MKKVLESYYKLRDTLIGEGYSYTEDFEPMLEIEKSLLVLKTIKEKQVNVRNLIIYSFEMKESYEDYVDRFNYCDNFYELGYELLTEEEYNLLKEVLYDPR